MGSDPVAPSPQESTGQMLDAYAHYLPWLQEINAANLLPQAKAELGVSQALSPEYAKLQSALYDAYGPGLAATSNKINAAQQLSQAGSDLNTLQGPGKDLIKEDLAQQKLVDPEFYKSREDISGGLGKLLSSIDLSGKLSGGETEELGRAQARENNNRGIATNPSQTAALQNALTFGEAQHTRQNEAKGQLTNAIGAGTGFLPASQSGIDAFQVGTGRSSMPNAGDSKFLGVDKNLNASANNTNSQLLGLTGGFQTQQADINSQRRDQLDRFNQSFSSVVGSL